MDHIGICMAGKNLGKGYNISETKNNEELYPYHPDIVFLQTGSNDYVNLSDSNEEKVNVCMDFKNEMF